MREQDEGIGYASIALSYGLDGHPDKHIGPRLDFADQADEMLVWEKPLSKVLATLGIGSAEYCRFCRAAYRREVDVASELVAEGRVDAAALAEAIAGSLHLRCENISRRDVILADGSRPSARLVHTADLTLQRSVFIAPRLEDLGATARFLVSRPDLRGSLRVTTPAAVFEARAQASREARSMQASLSLDHSDPEHSARRPFSAPQGFVAGLAVAGAILSLPCLSPNWLLLRLPLLLLFIGSVALRFAAAVDAVCRRLLKPVANAARPAAGPHPKYSVLVALRDETQDCIAGLVASLAKLRWPRSRIEILLVCEADDPKTIHAVRQAIADKPAFRLVEVPPSFPRTKPKALNFALPLTDGEFVVLYDAEDRPSPDQLEAAWDAFAEGGPSLACLQAPLVITNGRTNWLTAQFATEYAALFGGLLPWLAGHGLPLPLGGTSNHFHALM